MPEAENISWYILKVAPQSELRTELALKDLGHEAFTPVEWKWKKVGDNAKVLCPKCEGNSVLLVKKITTRLSTWKCNDCAKPFDIQKGNRRRRWAFPIFVGYGFVGISGSPIQAHHHFAAEVEDYQGMLGWGDRPAPLRLSEVEGLRSMSGKSVRYVGSITTGDAARVKDGPLQGETGRVAEINGNEAKLSLEKKFLGMDVIRVSVDLLEAV